MELNLLQSLFLGFLSGLAEILPVSAEAHRMLVLKMLGADGSQPALQLMVHIATAFALYFYCRGHIVRMLRAHRLSRIPKKRRKRPMDSEGLSDFSLLKTTLIPIVLAFFLYSRTSALLDKPLAVAVLLLINGIILYVPQFLPGCNKDSGAMTRVDALLVGLGGAAATLPGVSCVGTAVSVATVRGMELKKAMSLALLMNIPVNLGFALFDLIRLVNGGAGSLSLTALLGAVLAGIAAFFGVVLAIRLLKKIADSIGFGIFGLYSWGAALLTFILFLATV